MAWQDRMSRDEFIAAIREGVRNNLTTTEIACGLGKDVNRNMVIGLANRAKVQLLPPKVQPRRAKQPAPRPPKPPKSTVKKAALPALAIPEAKPKPKFIVLAEFVDTEPVHFMKMPREGRCWRPLWPHRMGSRTKPSTAEMLYCGKPTADGLSWCPDCRKDLVTVIEKPKAGGGRKVDTDGRKAGWQYGT